MSGNEAVLRFVTSGMGSEADELAGVAVFLASEAAGFTGRNVIVDGGTAVGDGR